MITENKQQQNNMWLKNWQPSCCYIENDNYFYMDWNKFGNFLSLLREQEIFLNMLKQTEISYTYWEKPELLSIVTENKQENYQLVPCRFLTTFLYNENRMWYNCQILLSVIGYYELLQSHKNF